MKRIAYYRAPERGDLIRLKNGLQFTSEQMADLAGLASRSQWRKYTGPTEKRELSMQMHFYMCAMLTLGPDELQRVVDLMRAQGAEVELGPLPAGPLRPRIDYDLA